jgi:hypothetical protein
MGGHDGSSIAPAIARDTNDARELLDGIALGGAAAERPRAVTTLRRRHVVARRNDVSGES